MRRRQRRGVEIFNLSFLDVVSCGFGAIILLLVIVKIAEPSVIDRLSVDLSGLVQRLEVELRTLDGQQGVVEAELGERRADLAASKQRLARLRGEVSALRGRYQATRHEADVKQVIADRLETAKQELSEEMKRLLGADFRRPRSDALVGGIPVDSEYVIFVIDTSGSMQRGAWPLVVRKVQEVLDIPIPRISIPVMAGRNLAVMAEAAVRDFMLKAKGYNAASEFIERHSRLMQKQSREDDG